MLMVFSSAYTVTATVGRRLDAFMRERGVDVGPLAASVGLDSARFTQANERIGLDAFTRLLHILRTITGDDCIGLRYGASFRSGDSGAFGFAVMNAPNLHEALNVYDTYQRMIADYEFFDVNIGTSACAIEWRYSSAIEHPDQFIDFRALQACRMLRRFAGPQALGPEVTLMRAPPRIPAQHRDLLGAAARFGGLMNRIIFPRALLGRTNPQADPRLFDMMVAACEVQMEQLRRSKDLRLQVKEQIMAVLPMREASLARIASALAIGERSLQRRLAEMGTSFERLTEETRRELSDRLLTASDTPLAEISYLCGYSNASAYSRAAKAWYGVPPAEMRRRVNTTHK